MIGEPLLEVNDLRVTLSRAGEPVHAVRGLDLVVGRGEKVGLVGESGSGKSVTALAILGLADGARVEGSVRFDGQELVGAPTAALRAVRGSRIAMIFQDPLSSLDPVLTVGDQLGEVLAARGTPVARIRPRSADLLHHVGIVEPARRLDAYPHQLSGGMRQRVMIAMAIASEPDVLIADEPTTALDVTIQAQVMELLDRLRAELSMAILLITHDLGLVAGFADRVTVMYAGRDVESGPVEAILHQPAHPYSRGLVRASPRVDGPRPVALRAIDGVPPDASLPIIGCAFAARCPDRDVACAVRPPRTVGDGRSVACWHPGRTDDALVAAAVVDRGISLTASDVGAPLVVARDIAVWFPLTGGLLHRRNGWIRAVDGVSLQVERGGSLALVGESGSGKTTTARAIGMLTPLTRGSIRFDGTDLSHVSGAELRRLRRRFQMVFQDPFSSLDPRMRVGDAISEPLRVHGTDDGRSLTTHVAELLALVGLDPALAQRYPHEFSGGQRQRIAIARALALRPNSIICDEPTSALDVSIQAQVVNLLVELRRSLGLAYLFIAHDLAVVRQVADRVAVMYGGRIVETGPVEDVLAQPLHPYSVALLSAAPRLSGNVAGTQLRLVRGDPGDSAASDGGCGFRDRCWLRVRLGEPVRCAEEEPAAAAGEERWAACHFSDDVREQQGLKALPEDAA